MTDQHVSDRLAAFADGELDAGESAHAKQHLESCESCQESWERYQFAADMLRRLRPAEAPAHIWGSIASALDQPSRPPQTRWYASRKFAMAAAAVLLIAGAAVTWRAALDSPSAPWDVVRVDEGARGRRIAAGEWVETDAGATASVRIGEIGRVDIESNTRLQLLTATSGEHRLNLAHGAISVEIVAPPRIFFVETPSSTVVDLGCAYTMQVDQDGVGMLRVTGGWASLEWNGRESVVPAGASAPTRPTHGPGTPSFDDASERLRQALLDFDFSPEPEGSLAVVLSESRDRDTLTLWHLMSRVEPADRRRVFDRLVALTPLPRGVDRDKAMTLDADTMRVWREELAWTW